MTTSQIGNGPASAREVHVSADALTVDLTDGRRIAVPLEWFPRRTCGTATERRSWRLIGRREGMHWPDLDEDISVNNLLTGSRSGESQTSLKRWIESRTP